MKNHLLDKLTPEQRVQHEQDLMLFGTSFLYENNEGEVEVLDPRRMTICRNKPDTIMYGKPLHADAIGKDITDDIKAKLKEMGYDL